MGTLRVVDCDEHVHWLILSRKPICYHNKTAKYDWLRELFVCVTTGIDARLTVPGQVSMSLPACL